MYIVLLFLMVIKYDNHCIPIATSTLDNLLSAFSQKSSISESKLKCITDLSSLLEFLYTNEHAHIYLHVVTS